MMGEGTVNDEELVEVIACNAGCGDLVWTLRRYGRIIHKHACPIRREMYCQSHPECLDVAKDALRSAGFQVLRGEPMELPVSYHTDHFYLPVPEIYPKGPKALDGSPLKVGDLITVLVPADSGGSG